VTRTSSTGIVFALRSPRLADLLAEAREALAEQAHQHATQRGATRSVNGVALTWQAPHLLGEGLPWSAHDAAWYLGTFLEPSPHTDPLIERTPGALLFPYTYAARTRFWDAGWAHVAMLATLLRLHDVHIEQACRSRPYFLQMVTLLAEHLHLQIVLSLLALFPPVQLARYRDEPELARTLAHAWRRDTLASAIADIAANPHSRRAVVSALSYPHLEEALQPRMALPPYQLFQLLPDDSEAPISSVHEHRSLDVVGGAQLDFLHDRAWLALAGGELGRPAGDITVIAHNLHEYAEPAASDGDADGSVVPPIERWLCRVTDGYRSERGVPRELIQQGAYAANIERVFAQWQQEPLT
jgi:hypothetical protein